MTTQPVDDRTLNTSPVDDRETTDQHTQADDLVERIAAEMSGVSREHADRRGSLLFQTLDYIKELKAEVERLKEGYIEDMYVSNASFEAMTARATKAEEALRRIASEPEIGWGCVGLVHIAREALAEEKA